MNPNTVPLQFLLYYLLVTPEDIRRGSLALLTSESSETPSGRQQVFIAELESWPGNSGSPVFLLRGGTDRAAADENKFNFLGMIVASFVNKFSVPLNAGQPAGKLEAGDTANTGMTCIVPATIIENVLESAPAQRDRKNAFRSCLLLIGREAALDLMQGRGPRGLCGRGFAG
jgi:hypothetical protein